jgi:hypothetical protein
MNSGVHEKGSCFMGWKEDRVAQKVVVNLVDDLDEGPADETVAFGLDGAEYEIDLSEANADRLRELLADYVAAGRRIGGRRRASGKTTAKAAADEAGRIRKWAERNGHELASRGRIPNHVAAAYREARAGGKRKTAAKK